MVYSPVLWLQFTIVVARTKVYSVSKCWHILLCTVYGRILTFPCLSHCISPDQTQLQKLSRVDNPEIKVDGWRGEEEGEEDEEEEEEEEGEEDLMGEEQRVPESSSTALPPIEEGSIFSQTSSELFKPSRSVGKNLTIQTIHIKQLYTYVLYSTCWLAFLLVGKTFARKNLFICHKTFSCKAYLYFQHLSILYVKYILLLIKLILCSILFFFYFLIYPIIISSSISLHVQVLSPRCHRQ